MLETTSNTAALAMVILGALVAGFTTGFAGFGTGLVASGLWFHALPAPMVPPLVALASVTAQVVGLIAVRKAFNWPRAMPFLLGGLIGVPIGIAALAAASPFILRTSMGAFLVTYAFYQLARRNRREIGSWGGKSADSLIGVGGGFLGGFAGLSGPLPLIWLQLRGGESADQRAIYQPFNLIVLTLASIGMGISGQITANLLGIAMFCLPMTLVGAWMGARTYALVSPRTFQRVVLCLLLVSGCILIAQAFKS
ncbi:MAG: sulfite exporter TauE/SafE family protein [Hyphomicrobiaceae bacterium]